MSYMCRNFLLQNVAYILKASLSILQNLVKVPENKEKFEELKVKEVSSWSLLLK